MYTVFPQIVFACIIEQKIIPNMIKQQCKMIQKTEMDKLIFEKKYYKGRERYSEMLDSVFTRSIAEGTFIAFLLEDLVSLIDWIADHRIEKVRRQRSQNDVLL